MRSRSAQIATLLAPHRRKGPKWDRRLRLLIDSGVVHHSREMFDLALGCVDDGLLDELHDGSFLPHTLAEQHPAYATEFLGRYLDRLCDLAKQCNQTNPFDGKAKHCINDSIIKTIAENSPFEFAQQIAPRIQRLIAANELPECNGRVRDQIWRCLTLGAEHSLDDALLFSTVRALKKLAATTPDAVCALTDGWLDLPHHTIRFLLLSAWSGNGAFFAEKAAAYLCANPSALDIGYDMLIGEGNAIAAITRALLESISPHCSSEAHSRLEAAIRAFRPHHAREQRPYRGVVKLAFIRSLRPERLGPETHAMLDELERKFPKVEFTPPHIKPFGFVERALPDVAFDKIPDKEWLKLFRAYNKEDATWLRRGRRVDLWDVLGPLRARAKAERRRFASVVEKMADDILPVYFSTVLEGAADENADQASQSEPSLDMETLCRMIDRLHRLPGRPCGRAICSVIYRLSGNGVPDRLLDVAANYALNDPDPSAESDEHEGKELAINGINSVRGSAADAIASLLFKHPSLAKIALPAIEALTRDPSLSVRAVTVHALIALLNCDRSSAVRLFCDLCEKAPAVGGSHYVEDFIFYATFTHYLELQPLLRKMLICDDAEVKAVAAKQICLAAFRHPEAEADAVSVLSGDEVCRESAAQIYSHNHLHPSVRDICEKHLIPLFDDPSPRVRGSAGWFLHHMGEVASGGDWTIFLKYLHSEAFGDQPGVCLHEMQKLPAVPADVILQVAVRAIELFRRDVVNEPTKAFRFAHYTSALVVRLYRQAADEMTKTRCLDLLDEMISLGWNDAAMEMEKAER